MTALDDIPCPPVMVHRWLEGLRVCLRSGTPSGVWTVVSQHGPDVLLERWGPRGSTTHIAGWSELVEERHAEAARAEAGKHTRVARPLPAPGSVESDGESGE